MKKRGDKTKLIFGLLIVAVLIVAALVNRNSKSLVLPDAAFADAMPSGGKGLALLLNRTGYRSRVQDAPLQNMPADARVWLLIGPKVSFTTREGKLLLNWVKAGGTLIYSAQRGEGFSAFNPGGAPAATGVGEVEEALEITPNPPNMNAIFGGGALPDLHGVTFDVPSNLRAGVKNAVGSDGNFSVGRPHAAIAGAPGGTIARIPYGQGQVWAVPNAWIFTNYALAQPDTAVLVSNLFRTEALPTGGQNAVYFDERSHDENGRPPVPDTLIRRLKKPPVSYALLQLLGAGLLLWTFAARRLGTAVPLPQRGSVTRASQFAQAMGALFSKSARPRAAADIIGADFRKRLAARVGLSPAEKDEVLARRAGELSGVPYDVIDRLLLQTRTPATSEAQALRDAQEMDAVLKRLQ